MIIILILAAFTSIFIFVQDGIKLRRIRGYKEEIIEQKKLRKRIGIELSIIVIVILISFIL